MDHQSSRGLQQFKNYVGIKFQLYNSLFTSLPFHRIEKTGILLSLLLNNCEEGFKRKLSPVQIIEEFFEKHTSYNKEQEKIDLLFRFIQYVERQVVLFDALEDAAFREVNDTSGIGTLKHLESEIIQENAQEQLAEKLKDFSIRLVLTAHPTQFYPGTVLGIINDLSRALQENNAAQINTYLQQLGKTPFFKKQKPTPYDEAISLVWYLENVFYQAAGRIINFMKQQFPDALPANNPVITMGFWPGGDRDGNPNVRVDTTLKVADTLRGSIIKCYYLDVRRLKRRLTFKGVDTILNDLEKQLYNNIFIPGQRTALSKQALLDELFKIRDILVYQHNGLFQHLVDSLINKIQVFGLHFASLDIRQDSSVHNTVLEAIAAKGDGLPANYASLSTAEKINTLTSLNSRSNADLYEDGVVRDTLETINAIRTIQEYNGQAGCNRYIISQCNSVLNVLEVFALFTLCGWKKDELTIDIVPLFETIDDLQQAGEIMAALYSHPVYRQHLANSGNRQTIMLGFSDGTKDGGYLMANWSIFKAKEELTRLSKEYEIDVLFFDGRGGPPARGGGKTHKFYASMGRNISNEEIQLTIQGQTVSSNFGTVDSAQFNIEQLLNAGISNDLFSTKETTLDQQEEELLRELANESLVAYSALKNHPDFLEYLSNVSPLKFYSETNIGSRPAKRGSGGKLSLKDLRAIPFVGAWSQLKQNVTGYYGVGMALQTLDKKGKTPELKKLYQQSLFFKTLIDNCEMAMKKCFFPLTEFLSQDARYGEIWNMIYNEYELTQRYIFLITGKKELMADYPVEQLSISTRERIVLPLTTIQQYALCRMRQMEEEGAPAQHREILEKLVIRSAFGIINAGRNSA
ncbi:phosphoenolpyruvate carboxylase [Pseudoflavitalea sp. G-6-1-2]|uniref:phosphoenolpyruvate carboxylase n=1 Tax=Pseudoflavitalea sp. G-6-1-2 TaxID=2728841 RepID=UPI00146D7236|nr:phosphoenolpyruvate carboxylase [Pseudoflavitalea sp. G-6-1-2]NML22725.1 phosphoenolpyruvate carboxylase [Pseudoflavitalea sp. G-6-1-2]